jgi:hypothetical protein
VPQPAHAGNGNEVQINQSGALRSDRANELSLGQPGLACLVARTVSRT